MLFDIILIESKKIMKLVDQSEVEKKFDYYLELAKEEDIFVTRNKKIIAVISKPFDGIKELLSLAGCLKEYDTGEDYDQLIHGDYI